MLDLCYQEDSQAEVDMNVVMTGSGRFVELQATAEKTAFDDAQLREPAGAGAPRNRRPDRDSEAARTVIVYCGTSNPGKLREFQLAAPDFEMRAIVRASARRARVERSKKTRGRRRCTTAHWHRVMSSPTIPASKWTRWAARPACIRRASPVRTRPTQATTRCCSNACAAVENRTARFVCVIALVRERQVVRTFRGAVEGRIIDEPRGAHGFGYDPLFYYEPFGCTFGEATR